MWAIPFPGALRSHSAMKIRYRMCVSPSLRRLLVATTRLCRRLENKMTIPAIVAALASVPAVFFTVWGDGEYEPIGDVIGWLAATVLWVEFFVLLMAAHNKREWLRTHKWPLAICLLTLVSLIFAAGGAQLLRLINLVGSIRILRASRIFSASRVIQRQMGLNGWGNAILFGAVALVVAGFVAIVLADPTSDHWEVVNVVGENYQLLPILLAGAALAGATYLVARNNQDEDEENADRTWEAAVRTEPETAPESAGETIDKDSEAPG